MKKILHCNKLQLTHSNISGTITFCNSSYTGTLKRSIWYHKCRDGGAILTMVKIITPLLKKNRSMDQ